MTHTAPHTKLTGHALILQKLAHVPTKAGVYRMLSAAGQVLYVGKAKNLKKRLTSYTQPERQSARIQRMIFETADLVVVQTASEVEALLLEANLIKSLKPKYNVIFRDDSSYPNILITAEEAPRVMAHRGAKKQKGTYFGPYPSAHAVHASVDVLERVFQLRTCSPSMFNNRTRPCLKYDIKRCSAPCVGKISAEDYAARVAEAELFLKGRLAPVQKRLQTRMQALAEQEQFEAAAQARDQLALLSKIAANRTSLTHGLKNADVFAAVQVGSQVGIQGFFYRHHQHVGNQLFGPVNVQALAEENGEDAPAPKTPAEILAQAMGVFLKQHYANRTPPKVILCQPLPADFSAVQAALRAGGGAFVRVLEPKRGEKFNILAQAAENAREALQRKLLEAENWEKQLAAFGEILRSPRPLQRVECFDISNISGTHAVASMVVAGAMGMNKQAYRKFTMRSKTTPDDYAMMKEALTRRYQRVFQAPEKRGEIDGTEEASQAPDVVMVDGGKGHLNVLVQVFQELEVPPEHKPVLCAIAKGEERDKGLERIFLEGAAEPLPIPLNSPLIFVLQRIRDEAHRFAIGFHRQKRSRTVHQSALDDVPNVGAKRKKALLLHFGSAAAVKAASVAELEKVEGVNNTLAQAIFDWFQN